MNQLYKLYGFCQLARPYTIRARFCLPGWLLPYLLQQYDLLLLHTIIRWAQQRQKMNLTTGARMQWPCATLVAKVALVCLVQLGAVGGALAQVVNAGGGYISDYQGAYKVDSFPVKVSGLASRIDTKFGLAKVCISVVHPHVSELKIELLSPDGTSIWLTNRNGGDKGANYVNACFRSNGFSGYIHRAVPPFESGEYIPDGRMEFVNNGQNPNGTWYVLIQDLQAGKTGQLNDVSLAFTNDPTPNYAKSPCSFENGAACQCADGRSDCSLLPDLIVVPVFTTFQIKEYPKNDPVYPGQLRFAVSIGNIGDGPLETFGQNEWYCGTDQVNDSSVVCPDRTKARQRLYQRIYQKNGQALTYTDRVAGTNYYDEQPGHNHVHVDDWVEFRLVTKDESNPGKPARTLVSRGRKVSFCLFDSGICNNDDGLCTWNKVAYGQKNLANYGLGNYTDCKSARQGISVGGYDTYGMLYEGQFIDLPKGLPAGQYYLEIEIDPVGLYQDKDRSNNVFSTPVLLSQQD